MHPAIDEAAIAGLKFSECLPMGLATEMLERRLQDPEATLRHPEGTREIPGTNERRVEMIGAIAGDIIGSVHEGAGTKTKRFPLFGPHNWFTDDTVLTVAVAESILRGSDLVDTLHDYFHRYPQRGYGGSFIEWAVLRRREPYNSWGNGSAMRVSPVGFAYDTLDDVMQQAERTAAVTHNHPEGIRGAQATAVAIYLARTGSDKQAIRQHLVDVFGYDLSTPLNAIRETYEFDVSCQGSVPQAIVAFLEAADFEDAIRNAISLGGDADTMACIAGGIAEAYWGVPKEIEQQTLSYLDGQLRKVVDEFNQRFRSSEARRHRLKWRNSRRNRGSILPTSISTAGSTDRGLRRATSLAISEFRRRPCIR